MSRTPNHADTASEPDDDSDRRYVTVKVWEGPNYAAAGKIVENTEPDEYRLPIADPDYGILDALTDDERVLLAEDIENHSTYAFYIEPEDHPAILNVHTNANYHDRTDWDDPIERGLDYTSEEEYRPFKCEAWGRVMMWVEDPSTD